MCFKPQFNDTFLGFLVKTKLYYERLKQPETGDFVLALLPVFA